MKLLYLLPAFLTLSPLASACLHVWGSYERRLDNAQKYILKGQIVAVDNRVVVCNSDWGWKQDQDNHLNVFCLPGYVMSVDGADLWYRARPGDDGAWHLNLYPKRLSDGNCPTVSCQYLSFDIQFFQTSGVC
ncbi:hypothetical protein K469DRAFT_720281 [Zopfia rhizophila CBS 207.26]|uniref:Uncharacterized protein n=1 Tax=Zopfia rhizophila CBS 207.26 TaxID=1314779 RepID=A0A6A6EGW7_9PEZI|nr:hypothetical protein K469DRAFT_720281 [Zopfia rhizophila CBS 207.26]